MFVVERPRGRMEVRLYRCGPKRPASLTARREQQP
jgi:hypothetical protein